MDKDGLIEQKILDEVFAIFMPSNRRWLGE